MLSPISIATRGRISRSVKKTLTIATIGLILVSSGSSISDRIQQHGGGSGVLNFTTTNKSKQLRERLLNEDKEIFLTLKIWIECQS